MTQNNVIQFRPRKTENEGFSESQPTTNTTIPSEIAPNSQLIDSGFNIEKFLPEGRIVKMSEEGSGFHQIPHKIFEFMIKATDTRVEAAVFACLIRYTLGFHRSACKASHTFIAEWVGFSVASVRRGVDGLVKKDLIHSQVSGNSWNAPTVYEIPVIKAYLEIINNPIVVTENSQQNSPQDNKENSPKPEENGCRQEAEVCREPAQYYADSRQSTVPTGGTKKQNINKELNKTLSPEKSGERTLEKDQSPINAYFASLFSKDKRISEVKHFDSFKYFYKHEDLEYLLNYLLTKGVPGKGEPVHSPMAFLARSISNIMPIVLAERDRTLKRLQREKEDAEMKMQKAQEEAEAEAKDEITFIEAMGMFHKAFPSIELQQKAIQNFAERYPMFKDNAFALREAAIREWAASQRQP